ncbi:hypothetical protein [Microbispora bryophytorum]|uniref:Carbohydrate kinase PfkB domain-containing protein n=1 Tax=Microbispora bryophytorum subsp. camponoti TaxID=1677852 RepID=A0ABR8L353_9ACTN|nr:hypothetical protein [Microbispora camponoti]MBD3143935.1 hypothetical protein [Microbispora camponoti]
MIRGGKASRWVVLGALHFDVAATIDRDWFRSDEDDQTWTDVQAEIGGVAGNIARHLTDVHESVDFLAVVGGDPLGRLLLSSIGFALPGATVWPVVVSDAQSGIVNILHLTGGVAKTRLMIAPEHSAVDAVGYSDLRDRLTTLRSVAADLIVDGYILRNQLDHWLDVLQVLRDEGWRIHLELVPHSGWRGLEEQVLRRLVALCATVSASLGTLERVLRLHSESGLIIEQRASRFLEHAQASLPGSAARITGRFGELNAEYCVQYGGGLEPRLWRYDLELIDIVKGVQDKLFVMELTGNIALVEGVQVSLN